jgi:glycosyltransferase involved in cell wall biosynthesis
MTAPAPVRSESMRVVVNMVAHNGEPHIRELLESITRQTRPVDALVFFDDASTDRTVEIVESFRDRLPIEIRPLPYSGYDEWDIVYSRVGQHVSAGLRELADADVIIMTDLDDVWEDDRVEHQVRRFEENPHILVIAGSGPCIDADGQLLGMDFHDLYRRPADWQTRSAVSQLRWTLWKPYGSGANMALRGSVMRSIPPVPYGWLCDRWVTLAGAALGGLDLDDTPVVRYRLHAGNSLGAMGAGVGGMVRRVAHWTRAPRTGLRRLRELHRLQAIAPTPELRRALSWPNLVVSMLAPQKWLGR